MDRPRPHRRQSICAPVLRLLVAAPVLCLVGCQNNQQAHRDIYLRELRLQEDEIYRLEDCIQEYQGLIRQYRAEMHELRQQAGEPDAAPRPAPGAPRSLLDGPAQEDDFGLRPLDPPAEEDEVPEIDVPAIDLGEPAAAPPIDPPPIDPPPLDNGPTAPAPRGTAPESAPPIDIPPLDIPAAEPTAPAEPGSRYGPAEELPPLGQLGETPPFAPTHDGPSLPAEPLGSLAVESYAGPALETGEPTLVALIRPRTLLGQPAPFTGQASLMLIDPTNGADGEKLARWDFSSAEVAASWRPDAAEPVLDLAVVLPGGVPQDRELELWVRLVNQPHDQKVLEQSLLVLGRLASIDEALLADAPAPDALDEAAIAGNEPAPTAGDWRASSRSSVAQTGAGADSGWRQSDHAPEPNKIRLATHEAAPLPAPPAPKAASPQGGPMEWSPTR
ncbi:hypothetical protein KOR34_40150 [Posidoniimonas corsicana]|uniref:Uncharacterized protein n=1 Tax=Posidoniimonas corsicana TaxID=1938618 RepID=A0A5C5V2T6_9BACT|nr:hypothetical protein [Posidoniimonas corsicana]TWT32253.1 hypothetical protein KOR34_40150 [Posidoniimonas corsicana]